MAGKTKRVVGKSPSAKGIGGWSVVPVSRNVMVLRCETKRNAVATPSPLLLVGDAHWDNPDCDRERLAADLDQAVERDSPVLIGGDFFCAMQGKFDSRSSKNKLLDEHKTGDYLDALVRTAAEWLEPWKDRIVLVCQGNHETSILRHHETNLTERLCVELRRMGGVAQSGGYTGWVRLQIKNNTFRQSFRLHYRHGHGGGGPVTMGKIDFNRYRIQAEYDAIWAQHVHHTEIFDSRVAYLTEANRVAHKTIWHIRTPSYKDEFGDGYGGFQIERGQGPRPKGGAWLGLYPIKSGRNESRRYAAHAERTRE